MMLLLLLVGLFLWGRVEGWRRWGWLHPKVGDDFFLWSMESCKDG